MGIVVVETSRRSAGAVLVATARGGHGVDPSAPSPFAFAEAADGRFVACLCDGLDDSSDALAARHDAARDAVLACARPRTAVAESISWGLDPTSSAALVVAASGGVHVGWTGAVEVIVVRDQAVLHRTVSRAMASTASTLRLPGIDLAGPWTTAAGDLVLLCSANVQRVLSEADVIALASRDDLATIVRGLVTTASTRAELVAACAIALRIASP